MRLKTRTWFVISVLCFLGAAYFWRLGDQHASRQGQTETSANSPTNPAGQGAEPNKTPNAATLTNSPQSAAALSNRFPYRLSNTAKTLDQLMRSETALMLQNALFDTSEPLNIPIPAHLRADGETGSYVVQSKGTVTDAFRQQLKDAGAEIVAYVPHNAYLVQINVAGAGQLRNAAGVQAVLAWEPYYKFEPKLLEKAVKQEPMAAGSLVNVLVFPGQKEAARQEIAGLGARVVGEDRSPFGTQFTVHMPQDQLVALAKMPSVQIVEAHYRRAKANDLGRVRLDVAKDGVTGSNYRGLTGAGINVNVNDTGVNTSHPDLPGGRITGLGAGIDPDGHGTHVAGTIAGSGAAGPISPTPHGSTNGAIHRGMAPSANLNVLPIDVVTGPINADTYLQETAALNLSDLSNNSWGYPGAFGYNSAAASWDAAVRDSLPWASGAQQMLYVFAAGNSGSGNQDGSGGALDSLTSPATAKNVISVGAIESFRQITNTVVVNGETNMPFLRATDSSRQVASFSSRGNVGFGTEGPFGRFKPDVVAPGTFVLSASAGAGNQTNYFVTFLASQTLLAGESIVSPVFAPPGSVGMTIRVVTNNFSPRPMPDLQIFASAGNPPTPSDFKGLNTASFPVVPDLWFYSLANTNTVDARYDLVIIVAAVNTDTNYSQALAELNASVGPWYRYESGTSMAAPMVSGMLALMHEFFHQRGETNSPALMKALLINGARSLFDYDLNVGTVINHQGWGLANLTNSLPQAIATRGAGSGSLVYFDQDPTNALATGRSQTRFVNVSGAAANRPLRFTLVWTDPPGNPAVGVKLVNDLDLIVTNLTTRQYYVGNAIGSGSIFSSPNGTNATNIVFSFDSVNNVENVFIENPGTDTFSVTVRARRVNVNAVNSHADGVVQDYALAVSSDRDTPGAVTVSPVVPQLDNDPNPFVIIFTNSVPTLNFRVGANSPLILNTNGASNQWTFLVFTNAPTNRYFAFVTFLAQELSLPRAWEADIDMFVSLDPQITNLAPAALFGPNTWRSLGRGGSEFVILSNINSAPIYVGIKSEDQQAATFGFAAIASDEPFSSRDENGNVYIRGYSIDIPDGTDVDPGGQMVIAVNPEQITIENVVVTNTLTHELGQDLYGELSHNGAVAVLNNHYSFVGTKMFVWDDSDSGEINISQPSDGLPTLRTFTGEEGLGVWTLTEIDNGLFAVGRVEDLLIKLQPQDTNLLNGVGITRTILPNRWYYTAIEVPVDATNLQVCVSPQGFPVEVYLRRGEYPDQTTYDAFGRFAPPGGCLNLTPQDSPPLTPGRYFLGVYNPNSQPVTVTIRARVERDLRGALTFKYRAGGTNSILDDAKTNFTLFVPRRQFVQEVKVGIRADHERASDLVFHLTSPSGNRVLLAENRDWLNGSNYGAGYIQRVNVPPVTPNGTSAPQTNTIPVGVNQGSIQIEYDFQSIADRMEIFYDGRLIFDTGFINGSNTFFVDFGPGNGTNVLVVMNRVNGNTNTAWSYTATAFAGRYVYANFTEDTNFATVPIKYGTAPFVDSGNTNVVPYGEPILSDGFERAAPGFKAPGSIVSGWLVFNNTVRVVTPPAATGLARLPFSGLNALDLQAGNIVTNVGTVASNLYLLNFAYTPRPTGQAQVSQVSTSWVNVSLGSTNFDVFAGTTNQLTNLTWSTTSLVFTATSSNTPVSFLSRTLADSRNSSMLIDAVTIVPLIVASNFWLPEEPLKPFKGEPAFGNWNLEVWDNRAGAGVSNQLLSWQLEMTFVNTNPPVIVLTNGQCYTGTVAGAGMSLFAVNAPFLARFATNQLTASGGVNLIYNPASIPVRDPATGDYFLLSNTVAGVGLVTTNYAARLSPAGAIIGGTSNSLVRFEPGVRYYLAVENNNPDTTNDFTLCVNFDRFDTNLLNVIQLVNGVCHSNSIPPGNQLQYYSFDASPLAITNIFETFGTPPGNLALVVRRGLPLPNMTSFDAISTNGTVNQMITLDDTNTTLSGRWYLGVANLGTDVTSYCIQATEISGYPTITLSNMVEFTNVVNVTNSLGATNVDYYIFNVPTNAYQVDVQTLNASGNIDLYVRTFERTPPPGTGNYFYFTNSPSGNEFITITTNTGLPAPQQPLSPGDWVVAVVNPSAAPVTYSIMVTIHTNQVITPLVNAEWLTNTVGTATNGFVVNYYSFDVSASAEEVLFELEQMTGNVDLYVNLASQGLPGPTNPNSSYSTNLGTLKDFLLYTLSGNTNTPALVTPATYYIAVWNRETTNVTYRVRATEIGAPSIIRLTDKVPYGNTVSAPGATNRGVDYYLFAVSTNAVQATFETYGADGNVDLFISKIPLPGVTNFLDLSTNAALGNEFIQVLPSGTPAVLSPGDWYLAVVTRETTNVTYQVKASEVLSNSIVRLVNGVTYSTSLAGSNALPAGGVHYYVYTVGSNAVQANFELFTNGVAPGDLDLYIRKGLPLPGTTNFMYAGLNPGTVNEFIPVTNNAPVNPLTPGDWYLAVVNKTGNAVPFSYGVRVSEIGEGAATLVRLTNTIPYTSVVATNRLTNNIDYYVFTVATNAQLAEFKIQRTSPVTMVIRRGLPFPTPTSADYTVPGTTDAVQIVTATNVVPLAPGEWYIGVFQTGPVGGTFSYTVTASAYSNPPAITLTNRVPYANTALAGGTDYYRFTIATNAIQANFEILNPTADVDLYILRGGQGWPGPGNYTHQSVTAGTANELIALYVGGGTNDLVPGDWEIAVVSRGAAASYTIVASQVIPNQDVIRLASGVAYTNRAAASGVTNNSLIDYYVFTVSTNAVRANFEVLNMTADLNLYLRKGTPLPDPAKSSYASENPGTTDELIVVTLGSSVPLSPGDWYLGVSHPDFGPVTYEVKATEYASAGTNITLGGINIVNGNFCITWNGTLPGTKYHLQGKDALDNGPWSVASATITAADTTLTTCLPVPPPYSFFRLAEGPATSTAPAAPISPKKSLSVGKSSGAILEWTAPAGSRFLLEWSVDGRTWTAFPEVITSTGESFSYEDPEGLSRIYRLLPVL